MHRVCPRDFGPLAAYDWGAAMYLYCDTCRGVLLEAGEVEKILQLGTVPPLPLPTGEPEPEEGTALCSCNGRSMKSVTREGVTVDVCSSCGAIWFDAGELERVMAGTRPVAAPPAEPGDSHEVIWAKGLKEGLAVLDLFDAVGWVLRLLFKLLP